MNKCFKKIFLAAFLVGFILNICFSQAGTDASNSIILCDKSSFTFEQFEGCGNDCNEVAGTCLDIDTGDPEVNSVWFTWTAENEGFFTFSITPLVAGDDLDFVLFELPNGLQNGTGSIALRCMASSCAGATGLTSGANDFVETPGCDIGDDGFLAPLFLERGKHYGLVILNTTEPTSTNGFTIDFGGDGTFEGPKPNISIDANTKCVGESVSIQDISTISPGQIITNREWNFGEGASMETANGTGPFDITYTTPGEKTITLVLTTDLGCQVTREFEVLTVNPCCENFNRIDIDFNIQEIDCPNDANGAINLTLTSNSNISSVEWSNGAMTEDIDNLFPGTYEAVVTNDASCTAEFSYTFIAPDPLVATETIAIPSCGGGTDGSITIDVTGGRPPYQYDFNDGNGFIASNSLSGLPVGDYQVTIMDDSGCSITIDGIELNERELEVSVNSTSNPLCDGESNGSVVLDIPNGITPYQYNFNTGNGLEGESALTSIPGGSYTVDVFDTEGCQGTFDITLGNPPTLNLLLEPGSVNCFGEQNGSAIGIASGGIGDYTYNWSNGSTERTLSNLAPGQYTLTVTDENGCTIERSTTVNEPDQLQANIISIQDLSCPSENNGMIEVATTGGTPPYQYSLDGNNFQTESNLTNLAEGDYTITVQDDNGCMVELNANVSSPAQLGISVDAGSGICYGETVTYSDVSTFSRGNIIEQEWNFGQGATPATASGPGPHIVTYTALGTPQVQLIIRTDEGCEVTYSEPLAFAVNPCCDNVNNINVDFTTQEINCSGDANGAIDLTLTSNPNISSVVWSNGETTEDLGNLSAGTYDAVVTNDASCTTEFSYTFVAPDPLAATETISIPSCGGGTDGAITVNVTGGRQPYQYDFNDGNGFQSTNSLTGLPIGDYQVMVMDGSGCTVSIDGIELNERELEVSVTSTTDPLCDGESNGTVILDIPNGIAPYQYNFNMGNGLEGQPALSNIPGGSFTVDVFDAEGCEGTFDITLINPTGLTLLLEPGMVNCFGEQNGSAIGIASGGIGDYTYNWSNGSTERTLTNVSAGQYTLTVTDENGCSIERSTTVREPEQLEASIISIQDLSCPSENNGMIEIAAIGGTPPYQYSADGNTFQTETSLTNLAEGSYTVFVQDDNGCTIELAATINSPAQLGISVDAGSGVCYGQTVTYTDASTFSRGNITAQEWSFGQGASPATATGPGPHTVTYTALGTPDVQLIIRTDEGCEVAYSEPLSFAVNPCCDINGISLQENISNTLCAGSEDGSIDLTINSAPPITSISWDNGTTTETISNLAAGNYTVMVSNDATCEITTSFSVAEPDSVSANSIPVDPSCGGASDGSIIMNVSGGTPVYEFDFGNGFTSNNIGDNLTNGTYTVTVRDANNCSTSLTVELQELELLPVAFNLITPSCNGFDDGSINLSIPNGMAPFQYDLGGGFSDETALSGLIAGTYDILIQDVNLCQGSIQISIDEPDALSLNLQPTNVSCNGLGDGRLVAAVTGGTGAYSYNWSSGETTATISNLNPNDYSVQILDANNCEIDGMASITEPEPLIANVVQAQNVACFGESNGSITAGGMGGNPPYNYSLDGVLFQPNATIGGLVAGDYTIVLQDQRGCEASTNASLTEPTQFTVDAGEDMQSNLGFSVDLQAFSVGGSNVNYVWTRGDSIVCQNCQQVTTLPPGSTTYTVTAISADNCVASDDVRVTVTLDRPVFIPNAFSPNGDGINDEFFIHGTPAIKNIKKLLIFDRGGALVFERQNIQPGDLSTAWDGRYNGTKLRYGVFVVIAEIEFIDNNTFLFETDLTLFGEE